MGRLAGGGDHAETGVRGNRTGLTVFVGRGQGNIAAVSAAVRRKSDGGLEWHAGCSDAKALGLRHGPGRKRPHGEAAVLELQRSQQVSSVGVCGMEGLGRHAQVGAGPDWAEGSGGLRRRPQTSGTCP